MICGKILLNRRDWEIIYICELCDQELLNLPELLKHVFQEHIKDVPEDKLREFCGDIKLEPNIEIGQETLIQPTVIVNEIKQEQQEVEQENKNEQQAEEEQIKNSQIEDVNRDESDQYKMDFDSQSSIGSDEPTKIEDFEFLDIQRKISTKNKDKKAKKRPYTVECNICHLEFRRKRELLKHKKVHGEKPHVCDHCGARFADKTNMQVHCRRHSGTKPYPCTLCEKAFITSTELNLHIRYHTGERPFKCNQCDRQFLTATRRKQHQERHQNIRSNLCTICGKAFYSNTTYLNHLKTHSTERPYKCDKCDAKFRVPNSLRQHKQLHSEVKKYSCTLCSKSFAQAAGLYSHKKTVHKNE